MDWHICCIAPVSVNLFQKIPALAAQRSIDFSGFSIFLRTCSQTVIQVRALLIRTSHKRCLFIGKTAKHGFHDSKKRNILQRIIDHPQKLEQGFHLHCLEITGSRGHIGRYPLLLQNPLKFLRPAGGGPKQNHHIAVSHRTQVSADGICHLQIFIQILDFPGDCSRLLLPCRREAVFCLFNHEIFRVICVWILWIFRKGSSLVKGGSAVILHTAQISSHNPSKKSVYALKDLGTASEIFVQINSLPLALLC